MLNPILQKMNPNSQMLSNFLNIKQMLSGKDPNAMLQNMVQTNPQFKQFYEQNKGKTPEQIASAYGVDINQLKALLNR